MNFFPPLLYQLRPGELDEPMQWLEPSFTELQFANANVAVSTPVFVVPQSRCLSLQSFVVDATPGAGQAVLSARLEVVDETLLTKFIIAQDRVGPGVGVTRTIQGVGVGLILPAGKRIRASGVYSAAGVANVTTMYLGGLLIPLGNFVRG